jgi:hypothetical protein
MKQITFQKIERKRDFNYLYIVFGFLITVYFSFLMGISYGTPVTPSYNGYIMNFRGEKIKVVEDVKAEEVIISTRDWKPYEELTYKIFGEKDGKVAYAIAKAESNLNPTRVHRDNVECSVGLFQINIVKGDGLGAKVHWDKIPGETLNEKIEWLSVPENNILIAKFIYGSSGFYPWTVYKNGVYKSFLN